MQWRRCGILGSTSIHDLIAALRHEARPTLCVQRVRCASNMSAWCLRVARFTCSDARARSKLSVVRFSLGPRLQTRQASSKLGAAIVACGDAAERHDASNTVRSRLLNIAGQQSWRPIPGRRFSSGAGTRRGASETGTLHGRSRETGPDVVGRARSQRAPLVLENGRCARFWVVGYAAISKRVVDSGIGLRHHGSAGRTGTMRWDPETWVIARQEDMQVGTVTAGCCMVLCVTALRKPNVLD